MSLKTGEFDISGPLYTLNSIDSRAISVRFPSSNQNSSSGVGGFGVGSSGGSFGTSDESLFSSTAVEDEEVWAFSPRCGLDSRDIMVVPKRMYHVNNTTFLNIYLLTLEL